MTPTKREGNGRTALEKIIVPLAVSGAIAAAGTLAHTVVSVRQIQDSRFTRDDGQRIRDELHDVESEAARQIAKMREEIAAWRTQLEQARAALVELRQEFRDHERNRTAHRE